jgi:hypothetical protein
MDAGALGALIGVGVMVAIYIFYYFHDIYTKRKEEVPQILVSNPILVKKSSHTKMNEVLPAPFVRVLG